MNKYSHQRISQLLDKFLEGNTTLEEESTLRKFFLTSRDIPEEWQCYKTMFDYFERGIAKRNTARRWRSARTIAAAASLLLLLGFSIATLFNNEPNKANLASNTVTARKIEATCKKPSFTASKAVNDKVKSRLSQPQKPSFRSRQSHIVKKADIQRPTTRMANDEELTALKTAIEIELQRQMLTFEAEENDSNSTKVEFHIPDKRFAAKEGATDVIKEIVEPIYIDLSL